MKLHSRELAFLTHAGLTTVSTHADPNIGWLYPSTKRSFLFDLDGWFVVDGEECYVDAFYVAANTGQEKTHFRVDVHARGTKARLFVLKDHATGEATYRRVRRNNKSRVPTPKIEALPFETITPKDFAAWGSDKAITWH
jgi:hypothetical protein